MRLNLTRWPVILTALTLAVACKGSGGEDSDDEAPPIRGGDDTNEPQCGGTNPEAVSLTLANGGLYAFEGVDYPTLLLSVDATDADGNLDQITLGVYWEDDGDGAATPAAARFEKVITSGTDACAGMAETFLLKLQVGESLEYNTVYDFAAMVTDSAGETSGWVVASGSTPKADGSDGDGGGP
ncbi:MAG: hypothetical protein IPO67_00330 [Deltaproteobacteria bacterium]|nr:hypothetical protein [Deltaproteobacteria bacterium]